MFLCNICIEPFNKSTRMPVACDYCSFIACRECCSKYILGGTSSAHCMNCKKEWTRTVLMTKFTSKFVNNDYKQHMENYLFETEQALLPATQILVENIIRKKRINDEIRDIDNEISRLVSLRYNMRSEIHWPSQETNRKFVRKCPNGDCRGFLSTQWKCGLCDIWVCPDCNEIKGYDHNIDHNCLPENIESVKLMAKDSKPCPSCSSLIFRIEGCDAMFCTMCHTGFSWRTGRFENVTHNPHYFEWLRTQGQVDRNPLDIQCGREIDVWFIRKHQFNGNVREILRSIIHILQVEIPRLQPSDNEKLRLKYLMGELSFDRFKILIQRKDKSNEKKHEIVNVLGMVASCATDIFHKHVAEHELCKYYECTIEPYTECAESLTNTLESLQSYANNCFQNISKMYNSKACLFDNTYSFSGC